MQVSACEALARIAEGTPESAAQMVEEGMIGLVKQAMEAHPEEKYVHVSACEALARIAEGARESAVQMVEEGMIGLVKHAMQAHPEEKQVQGRACDALTGIALGGPECAAQMVEEGMIGLIKQAMEVHPEEKQVQGRACDALTGIALGGPECAAQMVEKLRGQRLRASRKAPIQYSACAKRAVWIVTRPPKREFNRKSGPTRRWTSWWPRQEGWLTCLTGEPQICVAQRISSGTRRTTCLAIISNSIHLPRYQG